NVNFPTMICRPFMDFPCQECRDRLADFPRESAYCDLSSVIQETVGSRPLILRWMRFRRELRRVKRPPLGIAGVQPLGCIPRFQGLIATGNRNHRQQEENPVHDSHPLYVIGRGGKDQVLGWRKPYARCMIL